MHSRKYRGARSGALKFVEPSLPRHAPINKRMRACTDRGDRVCVQPPGLLCVSARAAKSSWTRKVCVLPGRLCAQLRGKGRAYAARARIYAPRCVLRGREASLWRVRASHRNSYFFLSSSSLFHFVCPIWTGNTLDCSKEEANEFSKFCHSARLPLDVAVEGMSNKLSFFCA